MKYRTTTGYVSTGTVRMSSDNGSRNSPLKPSSDYNECIHLEAHEHEVLQKDENVEENEAIAWIRLTT